MIGKILAVYDREEMYAEKLVESIGNTPGFPLEITIFREPDKLMKSIEKGKISVALVNEKIVDEVREIAKACNTLVIAIDEGTGKKPAVWKYRSITAIRKEVLYLYGEYVKNSADLTMRRGPEKDTKIIGVFSPEKSDSVESTAYVISRYLSDESTVLHVSLAAFSPLYDVYSIENRDGGDISDLIYYSKNSTDKLSIKIAELAENRNNISFIRPERTFTDFSSICSDDWKKLIEAMKKGSFDYIVVEWSESVAGLLQHLRNCDYVFMPVMNNFASKARLKLYEEAARYEGYDDIPERSVKIEADSCPPLESGFMGLLKSDYAVCVRECVQRTVTNGI